MHIKTLNRPHNTLNTHTTTKQNTSTSSYRYSTYLRNHIATWGGLGPGKSGWVLPAMTTTMATLWEVSCENRSSCDDCASSTKVSDCRMILHLPLSLCSKKYPHRYHHSYPLISPRKCMVKDKTRSNKCFTVCSNDLERAQTRMATSVEEQSSTCTDAWS